MKKFPHSMFGEITRFRLATEMRAATKRMMSSRSLPSPDRHHQCIVTSCAVIAALIDLPTKREHGVDYDGREELNGIY
jgi:hypothetical protein